MKVLVPVKRVIDPYVTIQICKDGSGVQTSNTKMSMNPFDEIAMEEAILWKEQQLAEHIIAVSIGEQSSQETLRQALALGADEAFLIETDKKMFPLIIARLLKWVVEKFQVDVVIMGKQAIDDDCNQAGQMLAELLTWPQATFASKIEFLDKKNLKITREIDGGLETLRLSTPCVITTDLRLNEPRYPSLPNIMKAKQKPLTVVPLSETGINTDSDLTITQVMPPPTRQAGKKVEDVAMLLQELRHVAKII